jgi:DNA-binding NtrC family response regulator
MADREIILTAVTDQSQLELLKKQLGNEGYEIVSAASVTELVGVIGKKGKISMAVVDISAFDQSVWEPLENLKKANIPYIVMTTQRSPSVQRESLKHGASGLFTKGLRFKDLLEYIHTLLGK